MRIIGGSLKGRKILLPKRFQSRPTTDFAREGLFNYLENQFDLSTCTAADLFAGSGAISFELVSRGCQKVVALEIDRYNLQALHKNRTEWGIENTLSILRQDAFKWAKKNKDHFEIIFLDPPFSFQNKFQILVDNILDSDRLNPNGKLILEHPAEWENQNADWNCETRKFGNQSFSIFEKA